MRLPTSYDLRTHVDRARTVATVRTWPTKATYSYDEPTSLLQLDRFRSLFLSYRFPITIEAAAYRARLLAAPCHTLPARWHTGHRQVPAVGTPLPPGSASANTNCSSRIRR